MQKILILSYFFPPCNLTPSQRVFSWAKFLNNYGYYPVFITRRWDYKIFSPKDISIQTPDEIIHETYPEYEVFYLPYSPSIKDRIFAKYGEHKFKYFRRFLSFSELILQDVCLRVIPYRNIYYFALDYLKKNKDVKKAVVTGNPYTLFSFAYRLHKKTGLKWIADYRDQWTTCKMRYLTRSPLFQIVNSFDRIFEKKWVGNASYVTSISDKFVEFICSLVKREGYTLYNGFMEGDFDDYRNEKSFDEFTITYVGTLFHGAKFDIFLEAFKKFIDLNPDAKTKLLLPGFGFFNKPLKASLDNTMKGYEKYYEYTERIERSEVLKIEVKSHLLLYVGWPGYEGVVPSKIYEYLDSGTHILVAPSDHGMVDGILEHTKCGVSFETSEETTAFLNEMYSKFLNGTMIRNDYNSDAVKQYSRRIQVGQLAKVLDKL